MSGRTGSAGAVQTTQETAPAGYSQQFGLILAGHVWQYKLVTSDATGLNIANGPAILGGVFNIAAGTMAAVYDSATAAGNVVIPSTTTDKHFNGGGLTCPNGITCDWTSGTWLVLYRAAA